VTVERPPLATRPTLGIPVIFSVATLYVGLKTDDVSTPSHGNLINSLKCPTSQTIVASHDIHGFASLLETFEKGDEFSELARFEEKFRHRGMPGDDASAKASSRSSTEWRSCNVRNGGAALNVPRRSYRLHDNARSGPGHKIRHARYPVA
jgi:hypothetical protein